MGVHDGPEYAPRARPALWPLVRKTGPIGPRPRELDFGQTDNPLADDIAAKTAALEALNDQQYTVTSGRKKRGRNGLSKDLLRYQIRYELREEEKAGALHTFFTHSVCNLGV